MNIDPIHDEETRPISFQYKEQPTLFEIGDVIDDTYEIVGVLGEGGMSCVYEAVEPELRRTVAIKALWPGIDTSRLVAEARVLASLRHPSLVTVHALGEHNGVPYLVLEKLCGTTLAQHIADRGQPRPDAVDESIGILLSLAEALSYIHKHDVVHRDLKPANIIITDSGRVVLLDFGLQNVESEDAQRIRGTPHYMAPESIVHTEDCDQPAIDIYALGIIAYELLTGHPPYDGTHAVQILRQQVRAAIPALRSECAHISDHLCRLITEMLAKDPAGRPSTADEIALWLRALRDGIRQSRQPEQFSVLIADDDPEMRQLIAACVQLAAPDAHIRTVGDGEQALAMFEVELPHVLLLDIDMPGRSGVEVCEHLYRNKMLAHLDVLTVSGRKDPHVNALLSQWGMNPTLDKRQHSHQFLTQVMNRIASARRAEDRNPPESANRSLVAESPTLELVPGGKTEKAAV